MSLFQKIKMNLIDKKFYKTLKKNPLLVRFNQIMRNRAENVKRGSMHRFGLESLVLAKQAFAEANLEFWLDYGTLLGAVREKDFISHDADIDIATFFTGNEDAKRIEKIMEEKGFVKTREFFLDGKVVEETYVYKGVNLDIFYYFRIDDEKVYCFNLEEGEKTIYKTLPEHTVITGLVVKKLFSTLTDITWIDFKGEMLPIPESFHQYLVDNYGETYMIKDENWDWSKMDDTIQPFEDNTLAYFYNK